MTTLHTHPGVPFCGCSNPEAHLRDGCPFCSIVRGEAEATVLQRWTTAMAIVPLNPVVPGHTLIIPTLHVADALERPDVTGKAFAHAAEYAKFQGSDACNLITSVGADATQTIRHLHVHVVPRQWADGLKLPWTDERTDR